MSSIQPELKTNEIYGKIRESLIAGEMLISETELFSLIREAKAIPNYGQSETILGLLYMVWGKIEKGIEHCENGVSADPFTPASWVNYALALFGLKMYRAEMDVLYRGISYESPYVIDTAMAKALMWSDIPALRRLIDIMTKLNISSHDELLAKTLITVAEKAQDDGIDELARCAMDIAESENIPLTQTQVVHDFDGNLVFCYRINDVTSEMLSDLNEKLAAHIVEKGLASRSGVAVFERG